MFISLFESLSLTVFWNSFRRLFLICSTLSAQILPHLARGKLGLVNGRCFEILVPNPDFVCEGVGDLQLQYDGGVYDAMSNAGVEIVRAFNSHGVGLVDPESTIGIQHEPELLYQIFGYEQDHSPSIWSWVYRAWVDRFDFYGFNRRLVRWLLVRAYRFDSHWFDGWIVSSRIPYPCSQPESEANYSDPISNAAQHLQCIGWLPLKMAETNFERLVERWA